MPTTNARVSFFDSEGNLVPGPIFEVHSTNPIAEIKMAELWPEAGQLRTEDGFEKHEVTDDAP
jgi:hypothetical protein